MIEDNNREDCRISPFPELPDGILEAYKNNELVIFVGAGVSRIAGCLGWDEMANKLIKNVCLPKTENLIIRSEINSLEKITIAKSYAEKDKELEKKFWDVFKKAITPKDGNEDIYDLIASLDVLYITTNCDGLLAEKFPGSNTTDCRLYSNIICRDEPYVFCIHGNFGKGTDSEKEGLIFTTDKYLLAYGRDSDLPVTLRQVMKENTVLFIGYGLREFEILSAVFDETDKNNIKHFVLSGFFEYEQDLCVALSEYYKKIGIKLLPFSKDKNGHRQLYDVLVSWRDKLIDKTYYNCVSIKRIDNALVKYNNKNQQMVLRKIKNHPSSDIYISAMIDELPYHSCCFDWICFLIEEKIVLYTDFPMPVKENELYKYNTWGFLDCLCHCLSNFEPIYEQKMIIEKFLNDCIIYIVKNEIAFINDFSTSRIAECCFMLRMKITARGYKYKFFQLWIKNSRFCFHILNNNIESLMLWSDNTIINFLSLFFSNEVDDNENNNIYYFVKLARIISERYDKRIIFEVLCNCIKFLLKEEGKIFFYYSSFDSRIKNYSSDYFSQIVKVIKIFLLKLDDIYIDKIFDDLCDHKKTLYLYQTIFYLAKHVDFDVISKINENPLDIEGTYIDFDLWLEDVVNKETLLYSSIKKVKNYILNSNYGYDLNYQNNTRNEVFVKRKINLNKLCLLKRLVSLDSSCSENINQLQKEDKLEINKCNKNSNIRSYKSIAKDKIEYFELDNKTDEEIFRYIIKISSRKNSIRKEYSVRDIFYSLTSSQIAGVYEIAYQKYEEYSSEFLICIELLNDNIILKKISTEYLSEFSDKIYDLICNKLDMSIKKRMVNCYIDLLYNLRERNFSKDVLLQKIFTINTGLIFNYEENKIVDDDILINLINISESKLAMLSVELMITRTKEKELKISFKNWIEKILINKYKWFILALGYECQNLLYIDRNWTNEKVIPVFRKSKINFEIALCMTIGSRTIIKEIVSFVSDKKIINKICNNKGIEYENKRKGLYYSYLVSSYFFKSINKDVFLYFISLLDERGLDITFRYVILLSNEKKTFLYDICSSFLSNFINDKNAVAFAKNFSHILDMVEDDWKWLYKISKFISSNNNIWSNICDCIMNTREFSKSKYVGLTIEVLFTNKNYPDCYFLDKIIDCLRKNRADKLVIQIAKLAVDNNILPNKYSKYVVQ